LYTFWPRCAEFDIDSKNQYSPTQFGQKHPQA
jgi:hypothetical protein